MRAPTNINNQDALDALDNAMAYNWLGKRTMHESPPPFSSFTPFAIKVIE